MNVLYKNLPVKTAIALGSNSIEYESIFREACRLLSIDGVEVEKVAPVIRTVPVDCPAGTPDFFNTALIGTFNGKAEDLLELTQSIEVKMGRPADHGFHDVRTLDLDIIIFGDLIMDSEKLILPHPRAQQRQFVLEPLNSIAPEWIFPDTGKSVKTALKELPEK